VFIPVIEPVEKSRRAIRTCVWLRVSQNKKGCWGGAFARTNPNTLVLKPTVVGRLAATSIASRVPSLDYGEDIL